MAIVFEVDANLTKFRSKMSQAVSEAAATVRNINKTTSSASSGVAGMFRRTPERRAERAFAGLGTALLTGDAATGIMAFTERLTGLGLAAGIGVGAAIGFISKLSKEIKDADAATTALRNELGKPLKLLGKLGPEELGKQLESTTKKGKDQAQHTTGFMHGARKFFAGALGGSAAEMDKSESKDAADLAKRQTDLSKLRADAELKVANLKLQAVTGDEKSAALAQVTLEAEEKKSQLLLDRQGGSQMDQFKSFAAIQVEEKAARAAIEKKFGAKEEKAAAKEEKAAEKEAAAEAKEEKATDKAKDKSGQKATKATAAAPAKQSAGAAGKRRKKGGDPYDLSKGGDPYDLSKGGDPYDLSKGGDPYDLSKGGDPYDLSEGYTVGNEATGREMPTKTGGSQGAKTDAIGEGIYAVKDGVQSLNDKMDQIFLVNNAMALTFLGTTTFARTGPEKWKLGQFDLDQLNVDYSGAITALSTFLSSIARGDAYSGDANMFLTDWIIDSNKQYPNVTLTYMGAKGGVLPPIKNQASRNIQSATSHTSSAIFPSVADKPATVTFYAQSNTITVFSTDSTTGVEPDDPPTVTTDDLITWTLAEEQPASSLPEIADWILENAFAQRINQTQDVTEVVAGQYWEITKRKMVQLLPYAPT